MGARCECGAGESDKALAPRQNPAEVLVVTSPGCHMCVSALAALEVLAAEFPIAVRTVDLTSPEGADVLRVHRPPAPPVFLVDGELLGFGRLPRRKLRKLLQGRASR